MNLPPILPAKSMATFENRLASFTAKWPHNQLLPAEMAAAGFYHKPTVSNDRVACFHCNLQLHGWLNDDNPFLYHAFGSKNCSWAKKVYPDSATLPTYEKPASKQPQSPPPSIRKPAEPAAKPSAFGTATLPLSPPSTPPSAPLELSQLKPALKQPEPTSPHPSPTETLPPIYSGFAMIILAHKQSISPSTPPSSPLAASRPKPADPAAKPPTTPSTTPLLETRKPTRNVATKATTSATPKPAELAANPSIATLPPSPPPTPPIENSLFACRRCPEQYTTNTKLHEHIRLRHAKKPAIKQPNLPPTPPSSPPATLQLSKLPLSCPATPPATPRTRKSALQQPNLPPSPPATPPPAGLAAAPPRLRQSRSPHPGRTNLPTTSILLAAIKQLLATMPPQCRKRPPARNTAKDQGI
ncbi:MAG: hypothetical protein M1812_007865 [Candelaria pacifica]|nr:MAG: hypothetical protein M1812_007865 [Candelaria pacifica]